MSSIQTKFRTAIAFALISSASAYAADVTVQPAAGSGFVVKGANESLRVQESGAVSLPSVPGAATQTTNLCMSNAGLLGPCSGGGGSGASYTAATGLTLTGTTFAVAPTYQLPQSCAANQIAQWNGTAWACGSAGGGATLPAGTVNQTLRYDMSNALVANGKLLAFDDGGLVASGTSGTGTIPASGPGARMMWYPGKAAFRAGLAQAGQWDDANVGTASFATGASNVASGDYSTALGNVTTASGGQSVATGLGTTASGFYSFATGDHATASGVASTATGGSTTASGPYSVAMGFSTTATRDYTLAFGQYVTANQVACAVIGWGESLNPAGCKRGNELLVHAQNGLEVNYDDNHWVIVGAKNVFANQDIATGSGASLSSAGTWNNASDRNKKENFAPVDTQGVLDNVMHLPLTTWSYKTDHGKYRHLGPMAQDFHASFGLGQDDISISTIDPSGVALAAIQGLNTKLEEKITAKDAEIAALRNDKDREIAALRARLASLESVANDVAEMKTQLAALRKNSPAITTVALQP